MASRRLRHVGAATPCRSLNSDARPCAAPGNRGRSRTKRDIPREASDVRYGRHTDCSVPGVLSRSVCLAAIGLFAAVLTSRTAGTGALAAGSNGWADVHQAAASQTPGSQTAGGQPTASQPSQAHVDDEAKGNIRKIAQLKPAEVSETCLTCHNRGDHAGWEGSAHDSRNLSCATCHSVHAPKSFESQLKAATQTALCAQCHRVQVVKTERAVAHMPVREGKMSCSSCHNPHGSITNVKLLRTGNSVAESCLTCHTEMRGPMLWEHAPVKENCASCHDPHGSSNDRMLNVRMPMLCQRCHVATRHPSSIYDNNAITVSKSNRMFGRSCVNCHSNVHGSNHPSGQFFMR
jgi:DmsE family decaheme c-type cytochrome